MPDKYKPKYQPDYSFRSMLDRCTPGQIIAIGITIGFSAGAVLVMIIRQVLIRYGVFL